MPKAQEIYTHDLDGNLTADGRWNYVWDAENRLVQMTSATSVGPQQMLKFDYDPQGRRIRKRVWDNVAGSGTAVTELKFLYAGWLLMAEVNASGAYQRSYLWGLDLSGTFEGAGGVGGYLAIEIAGGVLHFSGYDGNGNVISLSNGQSGAKSAEYAYGAFGEDIQAIGAVALTNPFRSQQSISIQKRFSATMVSGITTDPMADG